MPFCEICNNKRSVLSVNSTKDGHMICDSCIRLVARGNEELQKNLYEHCSEISLAEWTDLLDKPSDALRWNYSEKPIITKIGNIVFEDRKQIISFPGDPLCITERKYHYSQIYKYEYIENHSTVSSGGSGIGRAIVGGVLLGGAGAVVGAVTKRHTYEEVANNMYIRVVFIQNNLPIVETLQISDMWDGKLSLDSWTYERYISRVEKILFKLDEAYSLFHTEMNEGQIQSHNSEKKIQGAANVEEKLRQLKRLFQEDLISDIEYEENRKKVLLSLEGETSIVQQNPICEGNDCKKDVPSCQENVTNEASNFVQVGNILFELEHEIVMSDKNNKVWNDLCALLSDPQNTLNQYCYVMNEIAKQGDCIATNAYNVGIFNRAVSRVYSGLLPDEIPYFFADEGLFSHMAKVGYLVTNKRVVFLKKNNVISFDLRRLFAIGSPKIGESWYLNDDYAFSLSSVPWSSSLQYAMVLAFVLSIHSSLIPEKAHVLLKVN